MFGYLRKLFVGEQPSEAAGDGPATARPSRPPLGSSAQAHFRPALTSRSQARFRPLGGLIDHRPLPSPALLEDLPVPHASPRCKGVVSGSALRQTWTALAAEDRNDLCFLCCGAIDAGLQDTESLVVWCQDAKASLKCICHPWARRSQVGSEKDGKHKTTYDCRGVLKCPSEGCPYRHRPRTSSALKGLEIHELIERSRLAERFNENVHCRTCHARSGVIVPLIREPCSATMVYECDGGEWTMIEITNSHSHESMQRIHATREERAKHHALYEDGANLSTYRIARDASKTSAVSNRDSAKRLRSEIEESHNVVDTSAPLGVAAAQIRDTPGISIEILSDALVTVASDRGGPKEEKAAPGGTGLVFFVQADEQKDRLRRLTDACLLIDTTKGAIVAKDQNTCLTTIVIWDKEQQKYPTVLNAVHEKEDTASYAHVFSKVSREFGTPTQGGTVLGFTTDFSDAQILGFATDYLRSQGIIGEDEIVQWTSMEGDGDIATAFRQALHHVRGCFVHFTRALLDKMTGATPESRQDVMKHFYTVQNLADKHPIDHADVKKAADEAWHAFAKHMEVIRGKPGAKMAKDMAKHWMKTRGGAAWRLAFEMVDANGNRLPRSHLDRSTNGLESKHMTYKGPENLRGVHRDKGLTTLLKHGVLEAKTSTEYEAGHKPGWTPPSTKGLGRRRSSTQKVSHKRKRSATSTAPFQAKKPALDLQPATFCLPRSEGTNETSCSRSLCMLFVALTDLAAVRNQLEPEWQAIVADFEAGRTSSSADAKAAQARVTSVWTTFDNLLRTRAEQLARTIGSEAPAWLKDLLCTPADADLPWTSALRLLLTVINSAASETDMSTLLRDEHLGSVELPREAEGDFRLPIESTAIGSATTVTFCTLTYPPNVARTTTKYSCAQLTVPGTLVTQSGNLAFAGALEAHGKSTRVTFLLKSQPGSMCQDHLQDQLLFCDVTRGHRLARVEQAGHFPHLHGDTDVSVSDLVPVPKKSGYRPTALVYVKLPAACDKQETDVEMITISSDDDSDVDMESSDAPLFDFLHSYIDLDNTINTATAERNVTATPWPHGEEFNLTQLELGSWAVMESRVRAAILQGRDVRRTAKHPAVFAIHAFTVCDRDFDILSSDDWYNDLIIDVCFIGLTWMASELSAKVVFFSPLDIVVLRDPPDYDEKTANDEQKRWAKNWRASGKKRARRVFKHHGLNEVHDWIGHTLLFPVCLEGGRPIGPKGNGSHWVLVEVSVAEGGIARANLWDSLGGTASAALRETILTVLTTAHSAMDGWPALVISHWTHQECNVQADGWNCGAFVCSFAERFVTPKDQKVVTAADGAQHRKKTHALFKRLRGAADKARISLRQRATS